MMRTTITCAVMVLVGTVLAGCSGGSSSSGLAAASVCSAPSGLAATINPVAFTVARVGHTATLLGNNDVLVVGGYGVGGVLSSAEVFRPATTQWRAAEDSTIPRTGHTATLLTSGDVLVTGGYGSQGVTTSAGRYHLDTASGQVVWSVVSNLIGPRTHHTATLLSNGLFFVGQVLLVGGYDDSGVSSSASVRYDPSADVWTPVASIAVPRTTHTATQLLSGQILIVGGRNNPGVLDSAELYDPQTDQWTSTASLSTPRAGHTATLLENGDVLVVGGYGNPGALASAELYRVLDPATGQGQWIPVNDLMVARVTHSATLLSQNKVLIAGGSGAEGRLSSAEIYDVATGQWTLTGSLESPRGFHTATLLQDGTVLVTGGTSLRPDQITVEQFIVGRQALLDWDRVSDPDVLGYKIYYGTAPKSYQSVAFAGREGRYIFSNLTSGATYYFAVSSFSGMLESCSSNEVSKVIP